MRDFLANFSALKRRIVKDGGILNHCRMLNINQNSFNNNLQCDKGFSGGLSDHHNFFKLATIVFMTLLSLKISKCMIWP